MNLLVNLPPTFYSQKELAPSWERLAKLGSVRQTSHNTPDEICADLAWADHILMWSWPVLDEALLDKTGKLGYAGHIDISQKGARVELERGIAVSVSRSGFSPAVAEMALGLILNGLRRISDYHSAMRAGTEKWVEVFPSDIDPLERELTGLTVGIVGLGQVGRRLAHFLQAFDVKLKVVDPFVPDAVVRNFEAERLDLDAMLPQCDVVVLCAASNDGTSRLLNEARINALKAHALLVNVARAALVDYAALERRMKKGDLFAAIDVFDQEPLPVDSPLRNLPGLCLTPHRAGGLIASVMRNINWLIDDFEAHLKGEPRKYVLTEAMIPSLDA
jgi:phosphoglycerate dehydrogenase-like enzyme